MCLMRDKKKSPHFIPPSKHKKKLNPKERERERESHIENEPGIVRLSLLCGGPTKDHLSFVVVVSRIVVSDRDPLFIILSMKRKRNDFLLLLLRMDFFFALNLVVGKFRRLPADKCLSSLFYYVFSNENSDYLFKLLVRSSSFFFSLSLSRLSSLSLSSEWRRPIFVGGFCLRVVRSRLCRPRRR